MGKGDGESACCTCLHFLLAAVSAIFSQMMPSFREASSLFHWNIRFKDLSRLQLIKFMHVKIRFWDVQPLPSTSRFSRLFISVSYLFSGVTSSKANVPIRCAARVQQFSEMWFTASEECFFQTQHWG